MAGLCDGGNEPPGSLNAIKYCKSAEEAPLSIKSFLCHYKTPFDFLSATDVTIYSTPQVCRVNQEKELAGSLVEKELPTEGSTGRNGEREKNSGQKKISDDRRH
ncbi:hypothetical protein ANN_11459 [Periplaneta americana]|uniref:Uncharacterized protein n=1 Tax=Periplaneta americana TaxID=6978 RepID=A0ABQ8T6L2_PERAM|nr:hypothetical protein ANN_11459 [Periplaneta americana]